MGNSRNTVLSGFIWSFGERILAQVVSLVVGIVLARTLSPEDYGVISIVMVFITICDIFVSSGFGTAIVRQDKAENIDFNTAFILSFSMSLILYIVLFFSSPIIASFYNMPILKQVVRVFGIRIIISSFNNIQQAYIQRQMKFKKFFVATLFGTLFSCVVGIVMAYTGFGVWALVAQYMTNTIIDTAVLFFVGGWKPKLEFSTKSAKTIYSFGWKMLCSQLIFTLSNDIRSLIIGKVFGSNDLAYYEQGKKYPAVIVDNINVGISKVMLPTFAKSQNNLTQLKTMLRKSIRTGLFIVAPLMCGFAAVSNTFVSVVLTNKWLPAVPFIFIFCIAYMTRPLEELCHRVMLAIGKSGVVMIIMVVINATSLALTIFATFILKSVLCIAIFYLVHTIISLICFMYATNKYIGYQLIEQLKDTFPIIFNGLIMGVIIYPLYLLRLNSVFILMIQTVLGIMIYFILSYITKIEEMHIILKTIKLKFRRMR